MSASPPSLNLPDYAHLLPPSWKTQVSAWLAEDTPSFDYGGFVVGEAEREAFELWLRNLWREKDRLMARFLETGFLSAAAERGAGDDKSAGGAVVVPVRLRHAYEVLDAFCFFLPALVGWAWSKVRW